MGIQGIYGLRNLPLTPTWRRFGACVKPQSPYVFMTLCLPVTITCLHRYKHNFRGWQNFGIARIIITSIESAV